MNGKQKESKWFRRLHFEHSTKIWDEIKSQSNLTRQKQNQGKNTHGNINSRSSRNQSQIEWIYEAWLKWTTGFEIQHDDEASLMQNMEIVCIRLTFIELQSLFALWSTLNSKWNACHSAICSSHQFLKCSVLCNGNCIYTTLIFALTLSIWTITNTDSNKFRPRKTNK